MINNNVINAAVGGLSQLLADYTFEIDKVYCETDSDDEQDRCEVTVNMKVKFYEEGGYVAVEPSISFTTGKIKDSSKIKVDPNQLELPESEA